MQGEPERCALLFSGAWSNFRARFYINFIPMSHSDHDQTGALNQPEQKSNQQLEDSELMSFENQPANAPAQEAELLKNAMNPLESRTARPTNTSDERKIAGDESEPATVPTVPPVDDGFINIDAED